MSFFVRPSKFRHVFGTPYRRPDCYELVSTFQNKNSLKAPKIKLFHKIY